MIITIDGPAGSGKSTAARKLAARMGIAYLDTGAMYRAATLAALRGGADLSDPDAMTRVARDSHVRLECGPSFTRVFLDGRDVTELIRSAEVSARTRCLAGVAGVREVMVARQRRIGAELNRPVEQGGAGGLVSEGRDQGSVVFPDADVKFFLDAGPEVRARRRFEEMQADGEDVAYEDVLAQLIDRDGVDRTRAVSPLSVPDGARALNTSRMSLHEVIEWLVERVRECTAAVDEPPGRR